MREAEIIRRTAETDIRLKLKLDGTGFIVELCGDVKALGLGEGVTGAKLPLGILVFNQRKFASVDFLPC